MDCVSGASDLTWLHALPAVQTLRRVWVQQYWRDNGQVRRREPKQMPPSGMWIRSPYDVEVSYGKKRDFDWIGYKVHLVIPCLLDYPAFPRAEPQLEICIGYYFILNW